MKRTDKVIVAALGGGLDGLDGLGGLGGLGGRGGGWDENGWRRAASGPLRLCLTPTTIMAPAHAAVRGGPSLCCLASFQGRTKGQSNHQGTSCCATCPLVHTCVDLTVVAYSIHPFYTHPMSSSSAHVASSCHLPCTTWLHWLVIDLHPSRPLCSSTTTIPFPLPPACRTTSPRPPSSV